jgi:hypothetical protein
VHFAIVISAIGHHQCQLQPSSSTEERASTKTLKLFSSYHVSVLCVRNTPSGQAYRRHRICAPDMSLQTSCETSNIATESLKRRTKRCNGIRSNRPAVCYTQYLADLKDHSGSPAIGGSRASPGIVHPAHGRTTPTDLSNMMVESLSQGT